MGEGAPLAIYTQSSSISPGRSLGLCGEGRTRRERTRAGRDGAAPTSPPPAPPPSAPLHACRRAASMSAMRDRAEADLRASDPRVRTTGTRTRRPDTKCTPANHGRELSARDLNSSLASTTACWPSARKGAALGRDRGARCTAARARTRPFERPTHATVLGVGCGVCQCRLAVPMSWLVCRLAWPLAPPRRWEPRAARRLGG